MFYRSSGFRILLFLCFFLPVQSTQAAESVTEIISVDRNGIPAGGASASISADGRYVAFYSGNPNLVPGDTNKKNDVFVRDRKTGSIMRVSVSTDGSQGNGESQRSTISSNGRYIAFESYASNLVPGDTGYSDIFLHDQQTGVTIRVSVDSSGNQANGHSSSPSLSAVGRFIAFVSNASNLVANDTNNTYDLFLHNLLTRETRRISVDSDGNQGTGGISYAPSLSADGRYIAFLSGANNLVANDTNSSYDVFVHDQQTGETIRVSVNSSGEESNSDSYRPSISANGRFVVFSSKADNLVNNDTNGIPDIFRHDIETGMTERISVDSQGNQGQGPNYENTGFSCFISSLGRYIAFESLAANLVDNDPNGGGKDMFIKNMVTGSVTRVDFGYHTTRKVLTGFSADGNFLVFDSDSDTLVQGDTNGIVDVFTHGPLLDPEISTKLYIPAIPKLLLLSPPL